MIVFRFGCEVSKPSSCDYSYRIIHVRPFIVIDSVFLFGARKLDGVSDASFGNPNDNRCDLDVRVAFSSGGKSSKCISLRSVCSHESH